MAMALGFEQAVPCPGLVRCGIRSNLPAILHPNSQLVAVCVPSPDWKVYHSLPMVIYCSIYLGITMYLNMISSMEVSSIGDTPVIIHWLGFCLTNHPAIGVQLCKQRPPAFHGLPRLRRHGRRRFDGRRVLQLRLLHRRQDAGMLLEPARWRKWSEQHDKHRGKNMDIFHGMIWGTLLIIIGLIHLIDRIDSWI